MVLQTLEHARYHANQMEKLTGEPHHVFKVPEDSIAYAFGYRFGTCKESERDAYVGEGAELVPCD